MLLRYLKRTINNSVAELRKMKKYFIMAVAALAAFSGCSSDDESSKGGGKSVSQFTATIESADGVDGEDKHPMNWSAIDRINVNGKLYTTASTTGTGIFTAVDGAATAVDGKYVALYPSNLTLSGTTLTLPETQTYDASANGIGYVPMVAVSTNTELEFKNICADLSIKVASGTVKKIKVTADKNLCGDFTLNTSTYAITAGEGDYKSVFLDCSAANDGAGVTADNTTFNIAIPPQVYGHLIIYLSADGTTYNEAMATKSSAGLGLIARKQIYSINYGRNAVQLWAGGPFFATMNMGQFYEYTNQHNNWYNVDNVGELFQWGGTCARRGSRGLEGSDDYSKSKIDIAGTSDDVATVSWGNAWRMPRAEELDDLMDRTCTISTWMDGFHNQYAPGCQLVGYKFEGKDGVYINKSVFFPAAGYGSDGSGNVIGKGETGGYWSSMPEDEAAQCISFHSGSKMASSESRWYAYSVRAVLNKK